MGEIRGACCPVDAQGEVMLALRETKDKGPGKDSGLSFKEVVSERGRDGISKLFTVERENLKNLVYEEDFRTSL